MRTIFTITFSFFTFLLIAQDCPPVSASKTVNFGKFRFDILNSNGTFNQVSYKTGIGSDGSTDSQIYSPLIASSNIWLGAKDFNANLQLNVSNYESQEYSAGPVHYYNPNVDLVCNLFDTVFTVTKEDVLLAIEIINNGSSCDELPESIIQWPAQGNSYYDEEVAEVLQAYFYDHNANAIYDPCEGDLPMHVGRVNQFESVENYFPSILTLHILNTNKPQHVVNANRTSSSISVYNFSYNSELLEDIYFQHFAIQDWSYLQLRNFNIGHWFDFEMGCAENDALGIDEEYDMLYVYNKEDNDCIEQELISSTHYGVSYLEGPRNYYSIEYEGDSLILLAEPNSTVDTSIETKLQNAYLPYNCGGISTPCLPSTGEEYYNILTGKDLNGDSLMTLDGEPTTLMFTGNPNESDSWSMCSENIHPSTTGLITSQVELFDPSQRASVTLAHFVTQDEYSGCVNLEALRHKKDVAQKFFKHGYLHRIGPKAPNIEAKNDLSSVKLIVNEIPYEYNGTYYLQDEAKQEKYKFEGIKIFQVASKDFDMLELDNPELSFLIYQGDIENEIHAISNYKAIFPNGEKQYIQVEKVDGNNEGISEVVEFGYDYLNNRELEEDKEYYFVAISYAYDNYKDFDINEKKGQQFPYLQTNVGLHTITHRYNFRERLENEMPYNFISLGSNWRIENVLEDIDLRIYGMDGKLYYQQEIEQGETLELNQLVLDLAQGVYFISILVGDKQFSHNFYSF